MPYSSKFSTDGLIRVGGIIAIPTSEGHSLHTVMQLNSNGIHTQEYEPGAVHEVVFHPSEECFIPMPLESKEMIGNQPIGALFDLQSDPTQGIPDFTTVYYSAIVNKSQKGVPKGSKSITYLNADGTKTLANIPLQANLPGEMEPFPTCVKILPVTEEHLSSSIRMAEEQEAASGTIMSPTPPVPSAAAAATSSKISPSRTSTSSPATASGGGKIVLKKPIADVTLASSTSTAAPATTPSQQHAPAPVLPKPAPAPASVSVPSIDSFASIPTAGTMAPHPLVPPSSTPMIVDTTATPISASTSLKRKREVDSDDRADVPGTPNSLASSAPPSPANKRQSKKQKRESIGEGKKSGGTGISSSDASSGWHFDLPADPRTFPLATKWTLQTLQTVIPALSSITLDTASKTSEAGESSVKSENPSTGAVAAATIPAPPSSAGVSAVPSSTDTSDADDHPLSKSLALEFAQWDSMQQAKQTSADEKQPLPSSSFFSYRTAAHDRLHYFDQLKRIEPNQLIAAPYVLDYMI